MNQRLSWREVSFEYKGFFAYHLVMMVLMFLGGTIPIGVQLSIAGAILLGITVFRCNAVFVTAGAGQELA